MTMGIVELTVPPGDNTFYTTEWYTVVESHLQWLLQHPSTSILTLDGHDAYKFEGDLTGLLLSLNIHTRLHYVIMRLNNMSSPTGFNSEWTHLAIPNADVVDEMMQFHLTLTKKFT